MTKDTPTSAGHGSYDHNVRGQTLDAAMAHFSRYGYEKATITGLAKAVGFSGAYIYKFSDFKQAVGEAICASRLEKIVVAVNVAIADVSSASEKPRRLFRALTGTGNELLLENRKLYDIAVVAARNKWPSTEQHADRLQQLIGQVLVRGRQVGESECKTSLDEATLAVHMVMCPLISPVQSQYNLGTVPTATVPLTFLILRSLSP